MAEAALEAFYSALLGDDPEVLYDRAPCGYLSTLPDGLIVKANQTFLALTGHARDDLVGRLRFVDLLTPGGRIYHETHYAPMLQMQGRAREIALDLVRVDGSRLPVLVNAVLERDGTGAPRVVRTAVFDATDRREYERELLRAKQRAESSEARATALARTLQQTLIPPTPPEIPGLDVAVTYRPAGDGSEVGGDFYDVFQTGDDRWMIAIGDVCGKGAEAAVVTALLRYTIRGSAARLHSPAAVLAEANQALLRHETDRFCTAVVMSLDGHAGSWSVTISVAGHPLPLAVGPADEPRQAGRPGPLLGVLPDAAFEDTATTLHQGESLVLYTDGVTEARSADGFFGDAQLHALMSRRGWSVTSLVQSLLDDVLEYQGGIARDDIAIVAVGVPQAGRDRSARRS